jgi:hypothetical protein
MSGISRGPTPPPVRTGPLNKYGQPLTEYEQDQQDKTAKNTNLDRGAANFYNAANSGANYDASYTDPRTGLSLNYKGGPSFQKQMTNFQQFTNTFGNMGGNANLTGSGSLTHGDAPRVQLDTNAINAGDAAAFSKAKDTIGASTQGLMKSIQNQFGGRGLRGSSIEGRAVGSALEGQEGQLADVSRSQAVEGSRRAVDLAKTQYTGDIEQRGQDIGAETANRQFAANQQQSKLASVLGLWNAVNGMRY